MDDWQRLSLYTESRLEDLRKEAKNEHLLARSHPTLIRWVALSTAILFGLLIWWVA